MTKRFRFNVLDIAIIFVAVALIASLFLRETLISAFRKTITEEISYTFEISAVETIKTAHMDLGISLAEAESGETVGVITSLLVDTTATQIETLEDGSKVDVFNPEHSRVDGSCKVRVYVRDDGYYIGNKVYIGNGSVFTVRDGYAEYEITVTDVAVVD